MLKVAGLVATLFLLTLEAKANEEINVTDGIWFRCEFAHSQIPPEDNCHMLDDDGFQVKDGLVYHVKIINSSETKCRHERVGDCFVRTQDALAAKRREIGPINVLGTAATVSWFGCAQKYHLSDRGQFVEITPDEDQCWWTPNKRYFVSRYRNPIKVLEEE